MPTGNDPTRIFKTPISPRKPLKLGASATWSKLKYQTTASFNQQLNAANNPLPNSVNGHQTDKFNHIVKIGPNGELFICYGTSIEVWDWVPSSLQLNKMEANHEFDESDNKRDDYFQGLYLVAALSDFKSYGEIIDLEPIEIDRDSNTYKVLLVSQLNNEVIFLIKTFGQFFIEDLIEKQLVLPPSIHGANPFTIKASEKFVGISSNEGSLTIFDVSQARPLSSTIDVDIVNDHCLFDIQGRFLVYVPKTDDQLVNQRREDELTQLNVPTQNPSIYSKIFETLTSNTLDGLAKLSDLKNLSKNSTDMTKYLSQLINRSKQPQHAILIDLITQTELGNFKPPNGISNISLSKFNSHLLTISKRGDQLYKWDFTRLPIEINLTDIQFRGKTGSIVEDINWYSNDVFQIVTKRSGSIHCFHSEINSKNWILPNLQIKQAGKVNGIPNQNGFLIGLNDSHEIYQIDLNGVSNGKYLLPRTSIAKSLLPDYIPLSPVSEVIIRRNYEPKLSPLAQIELETCLMGPSLTLSDKFEFSTYNFSKWDDNEDIFNSLKQTDDEVDDEVEFWKLYKVFGNEVPIKKLDLSKGDGTPVFQGDENDLIKAMESVLSFDRVL